MINNSSSQVYISDLLAEIKSIENIDLVHFRSADLIHNMNNDTVYVIYTINGHSVFLAEYTSMYHYSNREAISDLKVDSYKSALIQVLNSIKENK